MKKGIKKDDKNLKKGPNNLLNIRNILKKAPKIPEIFENGTKSPRKVWKKA